MNRFNPLTLQNNLQKGQNFTFFATSHFLHRNFLTFKFIYGINKLFKQNIYKNKKNF